MNLTGLTRGMLIVAAAAALPMACSVDGPAERPNDPPPTNDNPNATGGAGGTTTTSSTSSTSTGGPTDPDCPYTGSSPIDVTTLPECPNCAYGGAHCLPNGLVPAEFASQLDPCGPDELCVPDYFIETTGLFIPPSCTSVAGGEGRCLNRCIPQVAEQADLLPVDTCAEHEVCVPCYDPQDGTPTGSCQLSCDPGPVEPPATLPSCCDGAGTCVPPEAAGEQADKLGEDECPQENGALLCAPNVFVNDPNWSPPSCETGLVQQFFGSEYGPGVCLPDCLPDVDNFLLGQDGCADGFKCAPCLQPPFGQSSGACDL